MPSKGLPHWSIYRIGFSILQSYLEAHPDDAIEEWTKLDAEQNLKRSEYKHLVE
ncbi:hypothetical protein [Bacillus sp. Marseille-Q1617]|uniref:hypothetical protein n=1 Tax=Bacillus sp. Marseille-Q1617 TaxID=2736887 RepID=UPI00158BE1E1|nr:hypothetical protein [Bacillus sp. Marseille-Q1617]